MAQDKNSYLKDGSEWIDHEDCIVGNEAGLKNLIAACEKALENGEHYGNDLGDYVGVKLMPQEWFNDPKDSPITRYSNAGIAIFVFVASALVVIGLITIIQWLF